MLRKIFYVGLILLYANPPNLKAQKINYTHHFPDSFTIQNVKEVDGNYYCKIKAPKMISLADEGNPKLPVKIIRLLIHEVNNIQYL